MAKGSWPFPGYRRIWYYDRMLSRVVALGALVALFGGCSSDEDSGSSDNPPTPVQLDASDFTYRLTEGSEELPLFTTPVTHRPSRGDRAPDETRSGLSLAAAKREFEPVQLLIGPASGSLQASVDPFEDLGSSARLELAQVGYVDGLGDTLTAVAAGTDIELDSEAPVGLWLTVFVPEDAPAGEHSTTLHLVRDGNTIDIPLTLTVFDFTLPAQAHFSTQFNVSVGSLVPEGGDVTDAKNVLFEHRLTPTSATWPSGFNWNITWDNESAPNPCSAFYDEPDEGEEYSIGALARRYLLGEGWNGVGFTNAELFQFVDNSTPRPDSFCGISRGDHYGTDEYNQAWSAWLSALDAYLVENDMAERGYYYVQNEPQDDEDHRLAAHLCRLTKAAAPHLRIAVSDEPKPEIAEDSEGACGYDIWIAHVRAYQQDYAWQRQRETDEEVWFYSLDHDPDPYFNPTSSTNQGIHQRIIPWTAWMHRIRGWAYYDGGRFFPEGRATLRAELLREGLEDYEYLWLANGERHPEVDETLPLDETVASVASSMTSWTKDVDGLAALRLELGKYLEGSRDSLPVLTVESSRPRGAYYINFQDPAGEPSADPLVVDGNTYIKVGWEPYSEDVGYGWSGEFITDSGIALYGFDDVQGYSVLQQSYIYDDYGRDNLFEFDIAPGSYTVTVGVGRPAQGYANDPHNVSLEGEMLIDDEPTTDAEPVIERSRTLDINDGRLSLVVGGRSPTTGDYAYTFLAYVTIEPAD